MTRGRTAVGPRYVVRMLEVCLFFTLACSFAAALDSDRTIAQFAHTAWGPKDGAPAIVTTLAQTTDGYQWLGSLDGLYRFDGVIFERYQLRSGEPFPATPISDVEMFPQNANTGLPPMHWYGKQVSWQRTHLKVAIVPGTSS